MKKKQRWIDWVIRISLIVAICISVGLSGKIWLTSNRSDTQTETEQTQQKEDDTVKIKKKMNDIYVPEILVYHTTNKNRVLVSYDEVNMQKINQMIKKWEISQYSKVSELSKETYFHLLKKENMLELKFPDTVTLGIFKDVYQQKISDKKSNLQFDRVLISLQKDNPTIYFMNDDTYQVFEANVKNIEANKIIAQLGKMNNASEAQLSEKMSFPFYLPKEDITASSYTYLLNEQNPDFYAQALFEDAGDIKETDTKNSIEYSDGKYSRMSIDQNSGFLKYESYAAKNEKIVDTDSLLRASYEQLEQLTYNANNMHYFGTNHKNGSVLFRDYISGFPVFNQEKEGNGNLYVQMSKSSLNIETSVYSLQVPLPKDDDSTSQRTLLGPDLLNYITGHGLLLEKIQGLKMGYMWQKNPESPLVADLEPTWFVRYDNDWKDIRNLE